MGGVAVGWLSAMEVKDREQPVNSSEMARMAHSKLHNNSTFYSVSLDMLGWGRHGGSHGLDVSRGGFFVNYMILIKIFLNLSCLYN